MPKGQKNHFAFIRPSYFQMNFSAQARTVASPHQNNQSNLMSRGHGPSIKSLRENQLSHNRPFTKDMEKIEEL